MNVHSVSLKGKRKTNEDKHCIILNSDSKDKNISPVNLFMVADGHGGPHVSHFIQKNLPTYLVDKRLSYPLKKRYIEKVYTHLQDVLKTKYLWIRQLNRKKITSLK